MSPNPFSDLLYQELERQKQPLFQLVNQRDTLFGGITSTSLSLESFVDHGGGISSFSGLSPSSLASFTTSTSAHATVAQFISSNPSSNTPTLPSPSLESFNEHGGGASIGGLGPYPNSFSSLNAKLSMPPELARFISLTNSKSATCKTQRQLELERDGFGSHNHKEVTADDIANAGSEPRTLFKDLGHYAKELVSLVVESCQHGVRTPLQEKALDIFHSPGGDVFDLNSHWINDESTLQKYFDLFNDFFFFGALKGKVTFSIVGHLPGTIIGQCCPIAASGPTNYHLKILELDIDQRRTRMREYLGTFLHEMVHAFLNIHACRVENCHRRPETCGKAGHGDAWCDIAYAVEKTANEQFSLGLDLNVRGSYKFDRDGPDYDSADSM